MALEYFNTAGINTYTNPLQQDGGLIHAVNVVSYPYGGKSKRPGYNSFLNNPDNAQVNSLIAFPNINNNGTQLSLLRASGSALYYSAQGTGDWTVASNGTIANGAHFGAAILNNTLIGGDGQGSTRHSTNGSTFTNTTLAPIAAFFAQYQNRVYAAGTASTLFYSTTNDATNWNLSGTADSSSFTIPDEGKLSNIFVAADKLIATKNKGKMFNWDGYSLTDLSTRYGPSSPYAIDDIEDFRLYINQYGNFGFDRSNNIQLLSNAVQRYFYNRQNTGISGTNLATAPGATHIYDYFVGMGSVTDDFTQRPINNAVLNYNYQKNEYLMWQLADNPTALRSYYDTNNKRQLIFGNASGQCFQLDPTATSDNGQAIESEMVFLYTYSQSSVKLSSKGPTNVSGASYEKKWNWIRLFFNPGCEINIQVAFSNSFTYQHLRWFDVVDNSPNPQQNAGDGIVEFRFPQDSRSRLLFVRFYESSTNSAWTYYGSQIDAEIMGIS
jgi:hypothetical protein